MPDVPATAKKPSDRQAKKNEAKPDEAEDIPFTYQGHEYLIPLSAADDVEIIEMLEDDKTVSVVRQVLGKEQWEAWKNRNRDDEGRVKAASVEPFLKEMFGALGEGNSSASSSS